MEDQETKELAKKLAKYASINENSPNYDGIMRNYRHQAMLLLQQSPLNTKNVTENTCILYSGKVSGKLELEVPSGMERSSYKYKETKFVEDKSAILTADRFIFFETKINDKLHLFIYECNLSRFSDDDPILCAVYSDINYFHNHEDKIIHNINEKHKINGKSLNDFSFKSNVQNSILTNVNFNPSDGSLKIKLSSYGFSQLGPSIPNNITNDTCVLYYSHEFSNSLYFDSDIENIIYEYGSHNKIHLSTAKNKILTLALNSGYSTIDEVRQHFIIYKPTDYNGTFYIYLFNDTDMGKTLHLPPAFIKRYVYEHNTEYEGIFTFKNNVSKYYLYGVKFDRHSGVLSVQPNIKPQSPIRCHNCSSILNI